MFDETRFIKLGLDRVIERKLEPDEWHLEPELACPTPRTIVLKKSSIFKLVAWQAASLCFMAAAWNFAATWNIDRNLGVLAAGIVALIVAFAGYSIERRSRLLVSRGDRKSVV